MLNTRTVLVVLCLVLANASQYVPIPRKPTGVLFGSPAAQVNVELIYDPQCDGSADLNQNITELLKKLGNLTDSKISFRYYLLALPYHIFSMKMAQGYYYIRQTAGDKLAIDYINYVLSDVAKYGEAAMLNTKMADFENKLTDDVVQLIPTVSRPNFSISLKHGSKYDSLAREEFKHITGSMATTGTPRVFINGAMADGAEDWTVQAWYDKLTALL